MTAMKLLEMQSINDCAQKYIPLNLRPTLPRIIKKDRLYAESWYSALARVNGEFMLCAPEYRVVMDAMTGEVVESEKLPGGEIIGSYMDVVKGFGAKRQKEYISSLDAALSGGRIPDVNTWLNAQGTAFSNWYNQ